jgi:RHS repeat-associated protein
LLQAGTQGPLVYSLGYDEANQLTSAVATQSNAVINTFAYTYDVAENRLTEQTNGVTRNFAYNALNELTTSDNGSGSSVTYEWDGENRLTAINSGNQRTEYAFDGLGRRVGIRGLTSGVETTNNRFAWCGETMCESRTLGGTVVKRFFPQGVQIDSGNNTSVFFYTRDHLATVRELTDSGGNLAAQFGYDPFGRRTHLFGRIDIDFGFSGLYNDAAESLSLATYRAYDPTNGRWMNRDPFHGAEQLIGPNLYSYVHNDPLNIRDPIGLAAIAAIAGVEAEVGAGNGFGGQAGLGFGEFVSGPNAEHLFGYADAGASAAAFYDLNAFIIGESVGYGAGVAVSDANSTDDLKDWFKQININTPSFSVAYAWGDSVRPWGAGTHVFSATLGLSAGWSLSYFPNKTWIKQFAACGW